MSELEPEEKYSTFEIDIHNEENYVDDFDTTDGESIPEVTLVAIDQTVTRKIERQLSDSKYELSTPYYFKKGLEKGNKPTQ